MNLYNLATFSIINTLQLVIIFASLGHNHFCLLKASKNRHKICFWGDSYAHHGFTKVIRCDKLTMLSAHCSSSSVFIRCCPFSREAGFTIFLLQLLALCLSTCLDSGHPPSLNLSSLSPPPLASSRFSLVVLAFSSHSLQDPEQPSKHYCHPSSAHVHTI